MSRERGLKSGYLPSLDGWRTVAILSVMMFHDNVHRIGDFSNSFLHEYGDLGVDLFFAISGLLICTRLLEEDRVKGAISLRGFYLRRLFRITPAAWAFLATYTLLAVIHQLPLDLGGIASSVLMVRNFWIHWGGVGGNTWYTIHFWSLSIEEHFYLLLPGLLVFGKRWRTRLVGALALLFFVWTRVVAAYEHTHAAALRIDLGQSIALSFRSDMRLYELLIPAFFALLLAKPQWKAFATRWLSPWAVFCFLALSLWLLVVTPLFPVKAAIDSLMVPVGFSLIVIATIYHPRSWSTRVLETAPMKFVGRISYSLYLWQELFFPNVQTPAHAPLVYLQRFPFDYLAAFGCALASYYLIEKPLIRIGHRVAHPVTPGHADLEVAAVPSEQVPTAASGS
jgi:peptidoglycan/LPS O-acetylase OafA/YrhL